jgi:hypothetical protein
LTSPGGTGDGPEGVIDDLEPVRITLPTGLLHAQVVRAGSVPRVLKEPQKRLAPQQRQACYDGQGFGGLRTMTVLLEQAMAAIESLPADAQDAIAARLLAEVADEQAWAGRFEATTDAQWDHIAKSVRQTIETGDLVQLDDVFPRALP